MNKTLLLGRMTKDIDLRYSQGGVAFGGFTLAVNRKFKKEGQPDADFISCKAFGKTAEFISKYMSKGTQIALEGHIQTGSYDKDGAKVYTTDVMIDGVYFADSKKPDNAGDAYEDRDPSLPF